MSAVPCPYAYPFKWYERKHVVLNFFRYEKFHLLLAFFDHIFGTVQYFTNRFAPRERSRETDIRTVPLHVFRHGMSTHDNETTVTHAGEVALLTRHFPFHSWQAKVNYEQQRILCWKVRSLPWWNRFSDFFISARAASEKHSVSDARCRGLPPPRPELPLAERLGGTRLASRVFRLQLGRKWRYRKTDFTIVQNALF